MFLFVLIFSLQFSLKGDKMSIVNNSMIYDSRPADVRTAEEECTYDFLQTNNIPFLRIDHSPADTIESCHEIEKYLGAEICKNLFLRNSAKTQFYLLLMVGDKAFVSKDISKKLFSTRLSFASAEDMYAHLKLTPGSVSVMGLLNDINNNVKVVVDSDLLNKEYFCCHPCKNTSTLKFYSQDIFDRFLPATGHEFIVIEV